MVSSKICSSWSGFKHHNHDNDNDNDIDNENDIDNDNVNDNDNDIDIDHNHDYDDNASSRICSSWSGFKHHNHDKGSRPVRKVQFF